jgi:hypothetical protein
MGRWEPFQPVEADPGTWAWGIDATPGVLCLAEHQDRHDLRGVAAHEFGHACTTHWDRERRGAPSDEWSSELAADWHAYRWGFGRVIARDRKRRDFGHHGPAPRSTFTIEAEEGVYHYRVTRHFCMRLVKKTRTRRGGHSAGR